MIVTMAFLTVGCSDDDNLGGGGNDNGPGKVEMTSTELNMVRKCNDFGFKMLKVVSETEQFADKNIILSPISFNYAFSMLANGANGATREQIIEAMGYDAIDVREINEINNKLISQLGTLDSKVILNVANSLWAQDHIIVKDDFVSTLANNYDAVVGEINEDSFVEDINRWCSDKTNGKISDIMSEKDNAPALALFNAVYFNGLWSQKHKFDKKNTVEGYFNDKNGTQSLAQFMNQKSIMSYVETDHFQKCELNFGNSSYRAAFILPKENVPISSVIDELSNGEWENIEKTNSGVKVNLFLPKYEVESYVEFDTMLPELGLECVKAVDADFSNISDMPLVVTCVRQKVVFEINEEGAEASTTTGIIMDETAPGPIMEAEMKLDCPFIYVLFEQSTGAILFTGCVNTFAD